jgi:hypothetical protein
MQIIIQFNTDLSEEADGQQLRRIVQRRLFAFKSKIKLTQINLETPPKSLVSGRFQARGVYNMRTGISRGTSKLRAICH